MEQYFNGLFHKKLAGALLKRIGISGTMPVHDLSEENLEDFAGSVSISGLILIRQIRLNRRRSVRVV